MISKELEMVFAAAVREVRIRRHELLTIEHILYALLDDEMGSRILRSCSSNILDLKKKLDAFFSEHLEALPEGSNKKIIQTVSFQRMLQRALLHAQSAEKKEVDAGDILASMLEEENSYAVYFLKSQGVSRLDILNYISHGLPKTGEDEWPLTSEEKEGELGAKQKPSSSPGALYHCPY